MNERFDELARTLAEGVSRREMLRRVGVLLAGGAVAALGLAPRAEAQATQRKDCHDYCAGQCVTATHVTERRCVLTCRSCFVTGHQSFSVSVCNTTAFVPFCS